MGRERMGKLKHAVTEATREAKATATEADGGGEGESLAVGGPLLQRAKADREG